MWLDEAVPAAARRVDDRAARSGADRRVDVEVVLGRSAHRLDPRRAQRADHHRRHAARRRHGHADRRTARRRKASRASPTSCCPSAARSLRGRRALLLALLAEHLPDWRPDPSQRRHVAVGAAARADEFGAVGGRVADGSRDSAGPAVRGGRHPGALHPGALHAARRPADRGRRAAGARLAQRDRDRATGADASRRRAWCV